jgi:adenosylcobinamide-GDP ribazoletransferase
MRRAPLARADGLAGALAGSLGPAQEALAVVTGVGLCALLIGVWAVPAVVLAVVAAVALTALARRKIGGVNGDVLGATQQLVELGVLVLGVAVLQQGWGRLAWWAP